MLRNPAYAGRAVFGKTQIVHEQPGLNRIARLQGRTDAAACQDRRPAAGGMDRDRRPGDRGRKTPSPVCSSAWKTTRSSPPAAARSPRCCRAWPPARPAATATTAPPPAPPGRKICYYRCLGSDNYRYEGGRVCRNKPVRADYLDQVVWDHITGLLADPALIRAEIGKRLEQARTSDPVTRQRTHLQLALAKAATSVTAMVEAYSEQLITIDELRAKMPHLRAREASLRGQLDCPGRPGRRPRCLP